MESQPAQRWIEHARTLVFARWLLKSASIIPKGKLQFFSKG
jgi:hypothetical protein